MTVLGPPIYVEVSPSLIRQVLVSLFNDDMFSFMFIVLDNRYEWMTHPDRETVEHYIASPSSSVNDTYWAYIYAKNILRHRWPDAEPLIATDPGWAYYYALNVVKGRFELGEEAIAAGCYADQYPYG